MSKKILSLALAVIMLFSVCAVAANAAEGVADGATVAIRVESDAKVGAPAGTTVNVTLYLDLPEGAELQMAAGAFAMGWNSAKFKLKTEMTGNTLYDARTWGDAYASYFKESAAVSVSAALVKKIVAAFGDEAEAAGWDTGCQVAQGYNTENASGTTGFPCHSGEAVFTLAFEALDTITATDTIGYVAGACGESFSALKQWTGTNKSSTIAASAVDMDSAVPAPEAATVEYDVYNLKGYDKTAPADKYSTGNGKNTVAVYFGLGMDPKVNAETGKTEFITGISATVTVTVNGETITVDTKEQENGELKYVYKVGEGYGFRVILQNVPDNADVTVTPAIVSTDSSAAYNIETVSFNVANAYVRTK